jgi:hypothetical protein
MSYSWVGAPAVFNGTDAETGGDSSTYPQSASFTPGGVKEKRKRKL